MRVFRKPTVFDPAMDEFIKLKLIKYNWLTRKYKITNLGQKVYARLEERSDSDCL